MPAAGRPRASSRLAVPRASHPNDRDDPAGPLKRENRARTTFPGSKDAVLIPIGWDDLDIPIHPSRQAPWLHQNVPACSEGPDHLAEPGVSAELPCDRRRLRLANEGWWRCHGGPGDRIRDVLRCWHRIRAELDLLQIDPPRAQAAGLSGQGSGERGFLAGGVVFPPLNLAPDRSAGDGGLA